MRLFTFILNVLYSNYLIILHRKNFTDKLIISFFIWFKFL